MKRKINKDEKKKLSVPSDQFVFVDLTLFQERDRSLPWSETETDR